MSTIRALGYKPGYLETAQNGIRIDPEPPAVEIVRGALYVPGLGALYREDGSLIPESTYYFSRGIDAGEAARSPFAPTPVQIDPAEYKFGEHGSPTLWAGHLGTHYGHFITDYVSRLWALQPDQEILFIPQLAGVHNKPLVSKLLALAQVTGERLFLPDGPTRLAHAVVPEPSLQYLSRIHACHVAYHRNARVPVVDWLDSGSRVYLTRSRLGPTKWKVRGEVELEQRLVKFGYEVVAPEALPIERQVHLFSSGATILGSVSSAFHTAMFAQPTAGKRIGVLARAAINPRFLMVDGVTGHAVTYFNALKKSADPGNPRDAEIDVEDALQMLDADGWL